MNLRQIFPVPLVLIVCFAVAGCGGGEDSGEVVQQPPVNPAANGSSAPAGGHGEGSHDGHSEMTEGSHAMTSAEPNGSHAEYEQMMANGHAEAPAGHGESHAESHGEETHAEGAMNAPALPGESVAHAEAVEGGHGEEPNVVASQTALPEGHGEAPAGHGEAVAANPMGIPGEGPMPGGHGESGEPPMPGIPGIGGEGGYGGEAEAGAGGLGGNSRPKTAAEAAKMVPQVPDDTPEYPVVELIRNILASNEAQIPEYIYPLRPKGLIGELFNQESRSDAIEKGQEMLMALAPAGRRTVGRDIWISLSNPDTGKLLTFVVRQYRGKYSVYDLNLRDDPNHRPSNNAGEGGEGRGNGNPPAAGGF